MLAISPYSFAYPSSGPTLQTKKSPHLILILMGEHEHDSTTPILIEIYPSGIVATWTTFMRLLGVNLEPTPTLEYISIRTDVFNSLKPLEWARTQAFVRESVGYLICTLRNGLILRNIRFSCTMYSMVFCIYTLPLHHFTKA